MDSMVNSTEAFIKAADWLGPSDEAAITALRHAASVLDNDKFTASMLAQWRGIYNDLRNREVVDTGPVKDEQDQFLDDLGV